MEKIDRNCSPDKKWESVLRRTFDELFNVYKMYRNAGLPIEGAAMNKDKSKFTLVISDLTYKEKEEIKAWLRNTYPDLIDDTIEKKDPNDPTSTQ